MMWRCGLHLSPPPSVVRWPLPWGEDPVPALRGAVVQSREAAVPLPPTFVVQGEARGPLCCMLRAEGLVSARVDSCLLCFLPT